MRISKEKLTAVVLVVLVGSTLVGCATQPVSTLAAIPVPPLRVLNSVLVQKAPDTGEVIIKRDAGFTGSACAKRVFADAKPVADLRAGEKVMIYLPEGEHIISAMSNSPCGGGLMEVKVNVKPDGSYVYRIGTQSNMGDGIYPTAF